MLSNISGFGDTVFPGSPAFDALVEAVIYQESRGNPYAVSPAGAAGLMQIMPDSARQPGFGIRPLDWSMRFDAAENRRFGTEYLSAMLKRYDGNVERSLAAYNWGVGRADKWDGSHGSLPKETQDYIRNITGGQGSSRTTKSTSETAKAAAASGLPFNERSIAEMQGVDNRLIEILTLAKQNSGLPFEISDGMRSMEEQKQYLAAGTTTTLNSKHLHGNAIDIIFRTPEGNFDNDMSKYQAAADAAKQAADQLGYGDLLTWGGDWKSFKDGPHFQIAGDSSKGVFEGGVPGQASTNSGSQAGAPSPWSGVIEEAQNGGKADKWAKAFGPLDQLKQVTGQGYYGVGMASPMAAVAGNPNAGRLAHTTRVMEQSQAAAAPLVTVPSMT